MFTRDEYNREILATARRVVAATPDIRKTLVLRSSIGPAELADNTPEETDILVDYVRRNLLELVGESELPEVVERSATAPQVSIDDEGLTADEIREAYNLTILEMALTCEDPGEWGDPDEELIAQIALVRQLFGQPGVDHAVDHLRVMLEISYLEPSELPAQIPPARGPVLTGAPGSPQEVFTFTVTLTRVQLDWITSVLDSMENNGQTGEARAAAILGGQIPGAYYNPNN